MKILYVSGVPTHPTDAGNRKVTLSTCEELISLGNDIHFLYIDERGFRSNRQKEFEEACQKTSLFWKEKYHVYKIGRARKLYFILLKLFRMKFQGGHRGLYDTYPFYLHKEINRLDKVYHFDACIVNYIWLTKAFRFIHIPKKACYTHDAMAYRNMKVNERSVWVDAAQEAAALQLCTDIFALQDEEAAYFHQLAPLSHVYTIYSKYEYHSQSIVGNKNILFLSGNNVYNQNGLRWFVNNVFPLIKNRFPDVKLLIAGGICKVIKNEYNSIDGIEMKGYVDNPSDFYSLGDVAINPTFEGTGLKIKTFESIANDKVTLVHPHSMAGIYNKKAAPLFVSDQPEDWADFLDLIWNKSTSEITRIKKQNREYIAAMNEFVVNEYIKFVKY